MQKIITESEVEQVALDMLSEIGYEVVFGPDIAQDGDHPERSSHSEVILMQRLRRAINTLNPDIPDEAKEQAVKLLLRSESPDPVVNNRRFHKMLIDGVDVEYRKHGRIVGDKVWLLDFNNPENNEFAAVNQFTVFEDNHNRRPDIVLFVNGLPLAVIELKNPADENATIRTAFNQFQTYKAEIPGLFSYNEILVISDGLQAKAGTITSNWERFLPWKTIDGIKKAPAAVPQIEVLLKGSFDKMIFLDLIRHFIVFEQEEAVAVMVEKYEIVSALFYGFDYTHFFTSSTKDKLSMLALAQEHILKQENGKERCLKYVTQLSKAFALSVPHKKALEIRDNVGFFQAVRAALAKFADGAAGKTEEELDSSIQQLISKAISSDQVIDIFQTAGLDKPDITILSDEFLAEVKNMPHKNLALEVLKKLLNDEIKIRSRKNLIQGRSFAEMLDKTIKKYQNKTIEAAVVIEELIELAKKIRESGKRGEKLGLTEDEVAFYDALEVNDSAVKVLGDETLRMIAQELVETVHRNISIDWTLKESIQAKLRVMVKRVLRKHGYPPDKEKKATQTVLEQAILLCKDWTQSDTKPHFTLVDIIPDNEISEADRFVTALPVYSLEAAASSFGKEEYVENIGWMKTDISRKLRRDMFIAKVAGRSMEPTIPDGNYCVFRFDKGGSRNGLIVLVESRQVTDPETNQKFTIKRYRSEKEVLEDRQWRHKKIILSPDNKEFKDIILENVSEADFRIVAEFVCIV